MFLFYSATISGNFHVLSSEESKHCIKVLRLKVGEKVHLTDGLGNLYETLIVEDNYNKCKLEIIDVKYAFGKRNFNLHIAVAPTKNLNRFEWFLEKATEIGIDTITPIICDHAERRTIQSERLNKIITAAMKQSLKTYHPKLNEAVSFRKFIQENFLSDKYIAICSEKYNNLLKDEYQPGNNALVLIGPEGDFSSEEAAQAINHGFQPVSLGNARLRTETAALVACVTINLISQKEIKHIVEN